jgi:lambda family phage portal protein
MANPTTRPPAFERLLLAVAPGWALSRVRSRNLALRHYEAATIGRRTANWTRNSGDANSAAGPALAPLRYLARDLVRNNPWARNAKRVITRNTVGWGIVAKPLGLSDPTRLLAAWKTWAASTQCDVAGKLTLYGIQKLAAGTIVESGEVLVRRWPRRAADRLAIPMQLQVLEPDFIDTTKEATTSESGGPIVKGIEFDASGRPGAYWLFDTHPGSTLSFSLRSSRVSARDIAHVFDVERPGQVRGPSWLGSVIVSLRDFDEFEDATLMAKRIAACFAGFIVEPDGDAPSRPAVGEADPARPGVEVIEPGLMRRLVPGEDIRFGNPPSTPDDGFSARTLRRVAAGIGVTYEDLTGDYSQVNFSSARMSRLSHWANVEDWQWNMLIPQLCDPLWTWAMEAAELGGIVGELPGVEWTPRPMPMIEPDREARANLMMIRSGQKNLSQVLREMGIDPEAHLAERAEDNALLDQLEIWLDSDPRRVSAAGLTQERVGAGGSGEDGEAGEAARK